MPHKYWWFYLFIWTQLQIYDSSPSVYRKDPAQRVDSFMSNTSRAPDDALLCIQFNSNLAFLGLGHRTSLDIDLERRSKKAEESHGYPASFETLRMLVVQQWAYTPLIFAWRETEDSAGPEFPTLRRWWWQAWVLTVNKTSNILFHH